MYAGMNSSIDVMNIYRYGIIWKVKLGKIICDCAVLSTVSLPSQQKPFFCKKKAKSQWTLVLTNLSFHVVVSCDSRVGIVTEPQAGQSGVWFTAGVGYFHSLSETSKPSLALIYFAIQCLLGVLFPGVRGSGREVDHSPRLMQFRVCLHGMNWDSPDFCLVGERACLIFLGYFTTFFIHAVFTTSKGKVTAGELFCGRGCDAMRWRHDICREDGGSRLLYIVGSHLPNYGVT
jgi:hypothetical protein